ncbi:TetR/AcrR family transcriptional regulator [Mycobacterium sp. 21AC1]|uniref:TetR/AcrR family transcriptional regulator n=1 Tax=[Mycobacterium] appelbergii TaxID=2939269 RepID=UPI002939275D|nr:helix-turn-helix domain-containing protein [Mycobacterium sp. 21AC1]MDV3130354.1 TetR/AcrR family transcriptional regulator [Mycobacterium sp. 21AC1]
MEVFPRPPAGTVDAKISDATLKLLRAHGPRAVTMEAVSQQSGVAKTTLYRRYRDRRELLRAALAPLGHISPAKTELSGRERLMWVVRQSIDVVESGIGLGGMAALLTDEDPEFNALFREILTTSRSWGISEFIELAELAGKRERRLHEIDPDLVIDMIVGSYIAERARSGQVSRSWASRVVAVLSLMLERAS